MLFCSQEFLLFFAALFGVYWAMPWQRARVWLLLAASFYFYAKWNKWLAVLICATTIMDYLIARGLEASSSMSRRRLLLGASLAVNLGLLVYFKYANFFLRSLEDALYAAGASVSLPVLRVLLPVGISFYTFEAINYTVDVYRGKLRAERHLGNFMLFILFFPHLIAGPIVRAHDFLPQIRRRKRWDWPRLNLGMQYFVMGMFKKLVVADRMALYVDPVFANPAGYGTGALWLTTLAWAMQVYCDFSGYTDMALGAAHLLGYKLAQNFNMPYLAANIADFWRRWHMSLSSWLRDYLFIPLGGSRMGRLRTYRNLLVTMALGGLWHGASWPYVVFGCLQGGLLIVHRVFRSFCEGRPRLVRALQTSGGTAMRVLVTFAVFCSTLVVFRAPTVAASLGMLRTMLLPRAGLPLRLAAGGIWWTLALVALAHFLGCQGRWKKLAARLPDPVLGCGYATALALAFLLAPDASKVFIYFQF
jgi:alginate O-acetyltransferase complex protein AlgI